MNQDRAQVLREMATQAAINTCPLKLKKDPDKQARYELIVGHHTYQRLKKQWAKKSHREKRQFSQAEADAVARKVIEKAEARGPSKPLTMTQAKAARRAKRGKR